MFDRCYRICFYRSRPFSHPPITRENHCSPLKKIRPKVKVELGGIETRCPKHRCGVT